MSVDGIYCLHSDLKFRDYSANLNGSIMFDAKPSVDPFDVQLKISVIHEPWSPLILRSTLSDKASLTVDGQVGQSGNSFHCDPRNRRRS